MTTIAVVGAGNGLGAAVARRFGAEGYAVALISRTQENVDRIAEDLRIEGLTARGFAADVRRSEELVLALDRAALDLGPIEVLEYSPIPARRFLRPVLQTTVDDLREAVEFSVLGPVTAVNQVLGGMRALGRGSILFVNGGSGARPNPAVAGTSVAFAGEGAYARMLHDTLADENIRVGQLIVPGAIRPGHPTHDPAVLAGRLWDLHARPGELRVFAEALPDV